MAIEECDDSSGERTDPAAATDTFPCDASTYTLTNDDVAKTITLVATYTTRNAVDDDANTDDVDESMDAVMASIRVKTSVVSTVPTSRLANRRLAAPAKSDSL